MKTFKIATWNVNSLRIRLPQVLDWLRAMQPDVLALQETKIIDEDFPLMAFEELGYQAVFSGQRAYNGVAVITKETPAEINKDLLDLSDSQKRVLAVSIGNIRILNLYVPNGESLLSPKYQYKLQWLSTLNAFIKADLVNYPNYLILGDFNIAPAPIDVHDPSAWAGHVLFSGKERQAFQEILDLGLYDCFRKINPQVQAYSWWDYRLNAFRRNMGLRIDHILASSSLIKQCLLCTIDKTPRSLERPSDHTPVVAEFTLNT